MCIYLCKRKEYFGGRISLVIIIAELNSRLRNLVFCLGDPSKIKEKTNLFGEKKTKGKVRQL